MEGIDPFDFGKRALFIGAGFSANYGGYLTYKFRNLLLSDERIGNDPDLLTLIQREERGFEQALQTVKEQYGVLSDKYKTLESAVYDIFASMHRNMVDRKSSYMNRFNPHRVNQFLSKFSTVNETDCGYIFSLNQDLLLERIFVSWYDGYHAALPGVRSHDETFRGSIDQIPLKGLEVNIDPHYRHTPIPSGQTLNVIKLHGSFNWLQNGRRLLILGGDKESAIEDSTLLTRYHDLFGAVVTAGHVRLFVIGYGFGDRHINRILTKAAEQHNLTLWIMDTRKLDETRKAMQREAARDAFTGDLSTAIRGYIDDPFTDVFHNDDTSPMRFHDTIEAYFAKETSGVGVP